MKYNVKCRICGINVCDDHFDYVTIYGYTINIGDSYDNEIYIPLCINCNNKEILNKIQKDIEIFKKLFYRLDRLDGLIIDSLEAEISDEYFEYEKYWYNINDI